LKVQTEYRNQMSMGKEKKTNMYTVVETWQPSSC